MTIDLGHDFYSQIEFSAEEFEYILFVTRLAASSVSLGEIFEKALPPLLELTRADAAEIWVLNPDSSLLELTAQQGEPVAAFSQIKQLGLGADIPGIAAQTLEPVVSLNLVEDNRFRRSQVVEAGYRAFSAFPMSFNGRPVGVLCLAYRESQLCDKRACNLLSIVNAQLAGAVRNSQLLEIEQNGKIEAELRQSEERYRVLVETSPDVVFIRRDTENWEFLYVNPAAAEMFGARSPEDMIGKSLLDFVHPDYREAVERVFRGLSQDGGTLYRSEGRLVRLDERVVLFDATTVPTIYQGQRARQVFLRDVSEHKKTQEAMETALLRLQQVLDTSPIAIVAVDSEQSVRLANREAERIYRLSPGDKRSLELFRSDITFKRPDGSVYAPEELPVHRALNNGERIWAEEIYLEFQDGQRIPILTNVMPTYSPEGAIEGAIAAVQDVTVLEELQKDRNEFLSLVSHEIRTPLATIKGAATTAIDSRNMLDESELQEILQIINRQTDRVVELVNNLLDITRIELGTLSVITQPSDLRTIVEEAVQMLAHTGYRRGVAIRIPDDLPYVRMDQRRVAQVLVNLLSNASKYSSPGTPITVKVEHDPVMVTVHVLDEGRGISEDMLPNLFRKFSRLDDPDGERHSGTGLGLAICKGIVEAHGGRVWAQSEGIGKGSTFSFTLPVSLESDIPASSAAKPVPDDRKPVVRDRKLRILAVDDEPRILRFLKQSFVGEGYEVIVSTNPTEAVNLMESQEPDVVLLDLRLPGISGIDVLKDIRDFSQVPVIFLTASDEESDIVQALRAGADDYMTKPFSTSELTARIGAVLRRRALTEPVEDRAPFVLGDLVIDNAARHVSVAGRPIMLTPTEYRLLSELAANAGRVLTYDQILDRVWRTDTAEDVRLIHSFVRDLRRKLGDSARRPQFILTQRGVGYMMAKPAT